MHRLFDQDALWCIQVIGNLRSLGLTVAEIRELAGVYLARPEQSIGPHLAARPRAVRARLDARIAELQQIRQRLDAFETSHRAELECQGSADFRASDPRFRSRSRVRAAGTGA
jgi:MerR family copper efflux transcriptional regulator